MRGTPLTIMDGARVEVEGQEVLVILTPFESNTIEKVEAVSKQLMAISHGSPLAYARREADGSYFVFGTGASEALKAKLAQGVEWTKIPVYPPQPGMK